MMPNSSDPDNSTSSSSSSSATATATGNESSLSTGMDKLHLSNDHPQNTDLNAVAAFFNPDTSDSSDLAIQQAYSESKGVEPTGDSLAALQASNPSSISSSSSSNSRPSSIPSSTSSPVVPTLPSLTSANLAASSSSSTASASILPSTSTRPPSSLSPSLSPSPSPSTSTSTTTTSATSPVPPPLFPRATAPSNLPPSAAIRKAPPPNVAGPLKAGVRGAPIGMGGGMKIPPSLAAKLAAMTSRSNSTSPSQGSSSSSSSTSSSANAPTPQSSNSASGPSSNPITFRPTATSTTPVVPGRMTATGPAATNPAGARGGPALAARGGGMMARRKAGPGLTLSAMGAGSSSSSTPTLSRADGTDGNPSATSSSSTSTGGSSQSMTAPNGSYAAASSSAPDGMSSPGERGVGGGTPFSNFRKIVDPSGRLVFAQKAVVHADGVDFSSGASFKIKMADFEMHEELGQGNYGTVQKVWHKPTKVTMALKEIRLELDDSKLKTIITELDILHRATSPFIVDFYGAFFIESCVYYCMEYMDAGSLELFAGCDVPEDVLARTTSSIVQGLKFLKDELAIMHRDVKPTNVLINRRGFVKLCDFGVSGQLDRSIAKTNIGCQSYMAPERIKGESQGVASTYTASSDVWSLGLSIIEFAIGHYPYPPETYSNVFAQLTAIVHGDPPALPEQYSEDARNFVMACLEKVAKRRPTYAHLLAHPWLQADVGREVDMVKWVTDALAYRVEHPKINKPALA